MIRYLFPKNWLQYDFQRVGPHLLEAKASVQALRTLPYQREWAEELQKVQFKREVAGTSRIEGADFTEGELEEAMNEGPEDLFTRSQRQARAAGRAYRWIAGLPPDFPLNSELLKEIHGHMIRGADEDHCPVGVLRKTDQNVTFGLPKHRGAEGGEECEKAFNKLIDILNHEGSGHDLLIRALAAHYHVAAIHPFLGGNGRTARALEALLLGRAGLRDVCFIAMSNFYYDEKKSYLDALAQVRANEHDLTPFLVFGLKGIRLQSDRVLREIGTNISKVLFRDVMYKLFKRMKSPKKRIIAKRQIGLLNFLLSQGPVSGSDLFIQTRSLYEDLKNPRKAFIRDATNILNLAAIRAEKKEDGSYFFSINLEWPTQITQTEFFKKTREMPKGKTYPFFPDY